MEFNIPLPIWELRKLTYDQLLERSMVIPAALEIWQDAWDGR